MVYSTEPTLLMPFFAAADTQGGGYRHGLSGDGEGTEGGWGGLTLSPMPTADAES
jgi:hypothetical protein